MITFLRTFGRTKDLRRKADIARDLRRWRDAAELYSEYLRYRPRDAGIRVQLGHALKEAGNIGAAEEAYFEALSEMPNDADLHLQLGHLFKIKGDSLEAATYYRKAAAIDPALLAARRELAAMETVGVSVEPPTAPVQGSEASDDTSLKAGAVESKESSESLALHEVIRSVYLAVLEREPETEGYALYGGALRNGMPLASFISELVLLRGTQETPLSINQIVQEIYRGVLGREAGTAGVQLYGAALRNGMSISALILELMNGIEFRNAAHTVLHNEYAATRTAASRLQDATLLAQSVLHHLLTAEGCRIHLPTSDVECRSPEELYQSLRGVLRTIAIAGAMSQLEQQQSDSEELDAAGRMQAV